MNRSCDVCGGPIRSSNEVGVCRATPACNREWQRRYRAAKPDQHRRYSRRYETENREARAERLRVQRAANPEPTREANRRARLKRDRDAYNAARREKYRKDSDSRRAYRARKLSVPSEPWIKDDLLKLYGNTCYLCRRVLGNDWHADHVVPLSRGGWDLVWNLRPACASCNISKGRYSRGTAVEIFCTVAHILALLHLPRVGGRHRK